MNNITIAFVLTFIAGLSTLIGSLFIFIKYDINKLTKYSLSFAAGVMISVSCFELMGESINYLDEYFIKNNCFFCIFVFILLGIIVSVVLNKLIPENKKVNDKKLYRVGVFSLLAIIIHNIPEGIATFLSCSSNLHIGISLSIAIALHNIPEGISIAVPIYISSLSKKRAVGYTAVASLAEPFGALLAFVFLSPYINDKIMGILLALIAGIMIHISLFKLLPLSLKYKEKNKTIIIFIIGFLFMYINHIIF